MTQKIDCDIGLRGNFDVERLAPFPAPTRAKKSIVGSGEEECGTESGIGDVVGLGVWQAFDHAVEAQAAELIGHGTRPEGSGWAAEFGQMVTQVGSAKALWQ